MQTKISTKGQIVLPGPIRRRLGLQPGDPLEAAVEDGRIVLTPHRKKTRKGKIVIDPITGFPALTLGPDAPKLTSKEIEELLSDFP